MLDLAALPGDPARVNLRDADLIRRMVGDLPDHQADLLDIACYVYSADQLTRRESPQMPRMGAGWRRSFDFSVAVRDPEFWSADSVREQLVATLSFLSDDAYSFTFLRAAAKGFRQSHLTLSADEPASGFMPDEVMLFSGGLDSFAGAADALLSQGKRVALVSHRSSPLVASVQDRLVAALRERVDPGRLMHLKVGVTKGGRKAVEFTQRTRSFLFGSLAFAVAWQFDRNRINFCENGVVSLNLPLAEHVLGGRASRTTHPRFLHDLGRLFSRVVSRDVVVANPLFWSTKREVVEQIIDAGCGPLIPATFSCAAVREATRLGGVHCGVCSQCLDRRFGVLGADGGRFEPQSTYAVDLFRGKREPGVDTIMAESYVLAASRHANSSQAAFLATYAEVFRALPYLGLPVEEAAGRLHRLHVRHGLAVTATVSAQHDTTDTVTARLKLPDSSLLAMLQGGQATDIHCVDPTETEPSAARQAVARPLPIVARPLCLGVAPDGRRVVFDGGATLRGKSAQLVAALLPRFLEGLHAHRGVDGYPSVLAQQLATDLKTNEIALRKLIARTRTTIAQEFRRRLGITVERNDVVQNVGWHGYRLNPYLSYAPHLAHEPPAAEAAD